MIDNAWLSVLNVAIPASTVIILAALGAMISERVGVLNLGQEGLIGIGAVFAAIAAEQWGVASPWVSLLIGTLFGALVGVIYAVAVVVVRVNQVLAGLALALAGIGFSNQMGLNRDGTPIGSSFEEVRVPILGDMGQFGEALFNHDGPVYVIYVALPIVLWFLLFRTRHGLNMRAVGENPAAADAVGVNVLGVRFLYTVVGCALSAAGGAHLVLSLTPTWSPDFARGRGWIALAVVIFASWRPGRVLVGALLFGTMTGLNFTAQARGWSVPWWGPQDLTFFLSMMPYLVTLIVILIPAAAVKVGRRARATAAPGALTIPYYREDR